MSSFLSSSSLCTFSQHDHAMQHIMTTSCIALQNEMYTHDSRCLLDISKYTFFDIHICILYENGAMHLSIFGLPLCKHGSVYTCQIPNVYMTCHNRPRSTFLFPILHYQSTRFLTLHHGFTHTQPPLSPNSLAQSSYSFNPCFPTDGRIFTRLASKSSNRMGRISSMVMCNSFSPSERSGPIAASLASAVMSEPEKPT
jgi:hypothetical protein